ncbi:DUF3419 family protein [Candidatus Entotheonella palauensis]|uniref:DUF3419 family protein n=1 Tax=Candidatus Entotheonella palauensis TaxID=93172 RepID=UPI000B7EDD78|nr:BtaA family protein [Candidatus Entotheonella palauensis]
MQQQHQHRRRRRLIPPRAVTNLKPARLTRRGRNRLGQAWFNLIHSKNLIYNTCWEDPRLDRVALDLGPDDTVLMITSAGCNVLDYLLLEPRRIYAVDINFRQNALLELKLAGIQALEFDDFFRMFGHGSLANYRTTYQQKLRAFLSPTARAYWDRRITHFSGEGWQNTFYYHGTTGVVARMMNMYATHIAGVRESIEALCHAQTLDEQRDIYYGSSLHNIFLKPYVRWLLSQDMTLSLLGVPRPQREEVERDYSGGIMKFIEDCLDAVFTRIPFWDNYFWQVYLRGTYTPSCCPEYLKQDNFERLKAGLTDRISIHTCTLTNFLQAHDVPISRVVLLDHMDWLSNVNRAALQQEWQSLIDHAEPGTRFLWRSGGLQVEYVDPIEIVRGGQRHRVGDLLTYYRDLATALHAQDRVHTYGSFYIADLKAA